MLAFTIGGQAGAGAPEIGRKVARELGGRYVEHMALRRLARELGATAEAVTRKELGFCSRKDRFLAALELLFSRIGWYGGDFAADGYAAVPIHARQARRQNASGRNFRQGVSGRRISNSPFIHRRRQRSDPRKASRLSHP